MKKIILTLAVLLTIACSGEQSKYGQGGENAVKYAKESTFNGLSGVKDVQITAVDSVLTDDMLDEADFVKKTEGIVNGSVTEEEIHMMVDSVSTISRDIYLTWVGDHRKDSIREKYAGHWHMLYSVTATLESGAKKTVGVVMDSDGVTPIMTDKEYKEQQKKKRGVIQAMTQTFNWDI